MDKEMQPKVSRFCLWVVSSCLLVSILGIPVRGQEHKKLRDKVREQRGDVSIGSVGDSIVVEELGLSKLVSRSKIVVKGRITGVKPRLSKDEAGILTDFQVEVIEMIKPGALDEVPKSLVFSLVGGKIWFPEGFAEVSDGNYPNASHPVLSQICILFLEPSSEDSLKYEPVAGSRGVFRILRDKVAPWQDTIVPEAAAEYDSHRKHLGQHALSFIDEIKAAMNQN